MTDCLSVTIRRDTNAGSDLFRDREKIDHRDVRCAIGQQSLHFELGLHSANKSRVLSLLSIVAVLPGMRRALDANVLHVDHDDAVGIDHGERIVAAIGPVIDVIGPIVAVIWLIGFAIILIAAFWSIVAAVLPVAP